MLKKISLNVYILYNKKIYTVTIYEYILYTCVLQKYLFNVLDTDVGMWAILTIETKKKQTILK